MAANSLLTGKLRGVECRSQCLRTVLLFLIVWITGMYLGYTFQANVGLVSYNQISSIIKGNVPFITISTYSPFSNVSVVSNRSLLYESRNSNITSPTSPSRDVTNLTKGCVFPDLDPNDPAISGIIKKYPTINCSDGVSELVYLTGDMLKVNHSKIHKVLKNNATKFHACLYKVLAKANGTDYYVQPLRKSTWFNDSITVNDTDENIIVECYNSDKTVVSRSYFAFIRVLNATETLLRENYRKHMAMHAPKETLSVLVIGIDAMSTHNFKRAMPQTRAFLLKEMNATEFHKYNKANDNTFVNVMPLLTGRAASEFLEGTWNWTQHFDIINDAFLWSHFRRAGYRTGLMLDARRITAFHFEKKGWNKSPVDYYNRPLVIAATRDTTMQSHRGHCIGETAEITKFHDYWVQLASTFNNTKTKPYFAFSFSAHLTHDDLNLASSGDELYFRFLKELVDKRVLNNTVIVFFSDHGPRFGPIRTTFNGIIEARTPFLYLAFPPWFHQKYPELMAVIKTNQNRLASHFDVHETLRDLLYFKARTGKGDINQRGISLFKEIPVERTCKHMGISTEYCVCNQITQTTLSPDLAYYLGMTIIHRLAALSEKYRHVCRTLKMKSVESAMEVRPDSINELDKKLKKIIYQIHIRTDPGDGLYEANTAFYRSNNRADVIGDIIRLNMYKGQADCVKDPRIKPFCYCKNIKKSK